MFGRTPLVTLVLPALLSATAPGSPERIAPNDNLASAGAMAGGILRLRLDTRLGMWHPDGDGAPGAEVPAFGEAGKRLQIPGPMIRVRAGTEVEVTVSNSVAGTTLAVYGLTSRPTRPDAGDGLQVPAGQSRVVRFRLDAPGTYYYWGTTTGRRFGARTREDAQLSGAIVVDTAGAPRDRVMVIGMWADTAGSSTLTRGLEERLLFVVNGRSWPHTTRLDYAVGDSVRWRVINASSDVHPMHLHGFYYRVDARGDGTTDSTYDASRRDRVVTERLMPGRTMAMMWVPERPGNWLFHCHFTVHFSPRGPLGMPRTQGIQLAGAPHAHANHALEGMNGLVMGVRVRPRGAVRATSVSPRERRIRLLARPAPGGTAALPAYGFALHEGGAEPPADTVARAGPTLVLARGEPVAITVVNRLPEPTAVHWHGIELESYFDGVAGFSGTNARPSPMIAPGDSFVARFTPPRAGTFIYHTHADELRQQPAGLAGVLVVLDSGRAYDPMTDIPVLISTPRRLEERDRVLLNGSLAPPSLELRAGATARFRFVNITIGRPAMRVDLVRDAAVAQWTPRAVDGADLPPARQVARAAREPITIGQTLDFEFTPAAGDYRLEARTSAGALLGAMPVRVR